MKAQLKQEEHYGVVVWVNPTTEALRRTECLCLNCTCLKPGKTDNCPYAQRLYEVCKDGNIALAVTRCLPFTPNEKGAPAVGADEIQEKIAAIRKRIADFHAHENDAYVYDPGEIREIREMHDNATADIEFLLSLLD
jgi:hypothetical protein